MAKKESGKTERKIPPKKIALLKYLIESMDNNRTIIISSALNIPSAMFQKIRKNLRGKASLVLVKKKLATKALEQSKKTGIKELEKYVDASSVFIFSEMDPYELVSVLNENKQPAKAKPGQIAPEDLAIEKGPTDLLPGPAISELGAVGLKVGVEGGKIAIKETKVIVKKGEVISKPVADVLQKMDIKPFEIGITSKVAYDSTEGKVYTNIIIDREGFLKQIIETFSMSLNFAVNIGYACKDTITKIIERAEREALAIEKISSISNSTEAQNA